MEVEEAQSYFRLGSSADIAHEPHAVVGNLPSLFVVLDRPAHRRGQIGHIEVAALRHLIGQFRQPHFITFAVQAERQIVHVRLQGGLEKFVMRASLLEGDGVQSC